jgi:pimeloyl-ACP methyl ester carboxylesterase
MTRTLREADSRSYWADWERIACPALVVRAGASSLPPADAQTMVRRGRRVTLVELAGAEHDLHLDRPAEWRAALSEFLDSPALMSTRRAAAPGRAGGAGGAAWR